MNIFKNTITWVVIIGLIIIASIFYYFKKGGVGAAVGTGIAIENYLPAVLYNGGLYTNLPLRADNTLQIGSSGTAVTQTIKGQCTSFTASTNALGSVSQPASSTRPYDCAVTGVQSGDTVIAQFATSTTNGVTNNGPWFIEASQASTTNGFITFMVRNNGAAVVPSTIGIGSSTNYIIMR